MERLFIRKVIQMKTLGKLEGIVAVEAVIHLGTKARHQFDDLPNICQSHDIPHALPVRPKVPVKDKHVDAQCGMKHLDTINKCLMQRRKFE